MPAKTFRPGDACFLDVEVINPGNPLENTRLVVALMINGQFWFWPGWTGELDSTLMDVPIGSTELPVLDSFIWPENAGSFYPLFFIGALLNEHYTEFLGKPDIWKFGYQE